MIYSSTISHKQQNHKIPQESIFQKILKTYWAYVDKQADQKVFWYMLVILAIPCVYMVFSILAMAEIVEHYEYFIGLSMVIFYANVMVHIGGMKSRIYVPLFHLTTLAFILIPLISYFVYK